jgi:hypothetical protein
MTASTVMTTTTVMIATTVTAALPAAASTLTATTAHRATPAPARRTGNQAIHRSVEAMRNRLPEVLASGNTAECNHHQQERVLGEIATGFLAPQALE